MQAHIEMGINADPTVKFDFQIGWYPKPDELMFYTESHMRQHFMSAVKCTYEYIIEDLDF